MQNSRCSIFYAILDISISMSANNTLYKNTSAVFSKNVRQITERTQQLEANARKALRRLPVVLNEQQIQRLREHKYASEGTTILDPYMQMYWRRLVEYFPLWVAPNLLTIIGLIINILTSILLMILTDGAREPVNHISSEKKNSIRRSFFFVFSVHDGCMF